MIVVESVRWDSYPATHHRVEGWIRATRNQHMRYNHSTGDLLITVPGMGGLCVRTGEYIVRGACGTVLPASEVSDPSVAAQAS